MMIMMRTRVLGFVCALLGLLLLSAPLAYGGKVYKWIINGKTVYMDKKPPSDKGKVEEKRIDDERNVVHMTPVDTEVSGDSQGSGPQRRSKAAGNNKPTATQNQTDKNSVGSTGTASTGRTPDARTGSNAHTGASARTGSSFVRGRGGVTAGPGATPGPGI